MAFKREDYPANWKAIRTRILERAGDRCEGCGVRNRATVTRIRGASQWYSYDVEHEGWYDGRDATGGGYWRMYETPDGDVYEVTIVLTIAHLDHDTTHNDDDNLKALCQRCHLYHDRYLHAERAVQTRRKNRAAQTGQAALF